MPAFEDLCRDLFDAADERLLILSEELLVSAYSLDRTYMLACGVADEVEGPWEGTVEIVLSSDAANSAASIYEDVFDEAGRPLEAAWEVVVRWNSPAVLDLDAVADAGTEIAAAAGVDDVETHAASEWNGARWMHRPSFEHSTWLPEDPEDHAADHIAAIAEDGLVRLQELAKDWPLVAAPPEGEPEEEGEELEEDDEE